MSHLVKQGLILPFVTLLGFLCDSDGFMIPTVLRSPVSISTSTPRMMNGYLDEKKGVSVTLGEYKGGAIEVTVPRMEVTDQMVEAALVSTKQPYRLVPVRFVEEGGTKLGHTVTINWEAKVDGTAVPGGKGENFLLDLKEDQEEPWVTFSRKIAVGMGQMETKVFPASFPMSFEVSSLQGKTALVTVVVKNIARKEEKPPETRSDDEIRTFLREKAKETFKMRTDQFVDEAVKQQLLKICEVDADKVLNSVSWAKFGEKSSADFKWNCIKERIALAEGIEPRDVAALLRSEVKINRQ